MFFAASKALTVVTGPWPWTAALALLAVLVFRRARLAGALLALCAAALPLLFASPLVADSLQRLLESSARDTSRPDVQYDVAVVLGGDESRIEAAGAVVRQGRARYVLYSGALNARDEAMVREELRKAGVPDDRTLIDNRSRNTRENAVESSRIIAARGFRKLLLITSAAHVDRALGCFRDVGLRPDVLPADRLAGRLGGGWLPRRGVIRATRAALHELIGRLMYRVMGYST